MTKNGRASWIMALGAVALVAAISGCGNNSGEVIVPADGGQGGADGSVTCPDDDRDGVTTCDGDCDDTDPLTYPGAVEICGDGIDNACGNEPDPASLCAGLGTFVSALTGNDTTGTGTRDNPVETIARGIQNAESMGGGTDVIVAEGTYPEAVIVIEGVSIRGGFRCSTATCDWIRDPRAHETIIDGSPAVSVSMGATISRSTVLNGVTVVGGTSEYAIKVEGGAPTLSNVVVNGAAGGIQGTYYRDAGGNYTYADLLITDSTVQGGTAAGIRVGGAAEITTNDIRGSSGIYVSTDGGSVTIAQNAIHAGDGPSPAIVCFSNAEVTIDRNHINTDPDRVGACDGAWGMCAGVSVAGGGNFVVTNNLIVGPPGEASVAFEMLDVEIPIGTVNLHSNTLYGSTTPGPTGGVSAAMACASQFGIAVFGSVRNNILLGGEGATSYGFFEQDQSDGRSCHPIVFENNNTFGVDFAHRQWSSSMAETLLHDISEVNALPYAQNNLGVDPMLDATGHLQLGSPCLDVGASTDAPQSDIDGTPRPSGAGFDIGADER